MAQRRPAITFEDIPLDEARTMAHGPHMDRELYHALREKISSLQTTATLMILPEGTNPATMKKRILRISGDLEIPVTIRRVPRGLLFWRATDEDLPRAKNTVQQVHSTKCPQRTSRRSRHRRSKR
jgi:hypothetical protein